MRPKPKLGSQRQLQPVNPPPQYYVQPVVISILKLDPAFQPGVPFCAITYQLLHKDYPIFLFKHIDSHILLAMVHLGDSMK